MRKKITIICLKHGEFKMLPSSHLTSKQGCRECKRYSRLDHCRLTVEQFIEKARKVHGDRYDYSLVDYINSKVKVKIICKEHGIFEQVPNSHLQGFNCTRCGSISREIKMQHHPRGWSYTNWEKRAKKSKNFDSFKVYIIKCWNDDEEFYKVGKTFRVLDIRFSSTLIPYNYEIIKIFEGEAREISLLESKIQKENKNFKYKPKIKFAGIQECFSKIENI